MSQFGHQIYVHQNSSRHFSTKKNENEIEL